MEAPQLHLAEQEFRTVLDAIEDRILHHCDRPEAEMKILDFLSAAHGPTTEGIATALEMPREAAAVHLRSLESLGRVWGQRTRGPARAWYLSCEGRRFLLERWSKEP